MSPKIIDETKLYVELERGLSMNDKSQIVHKRSVTKRNITLNRKQFDAQAEKPLNDINPDLLENILQTVRKTRLEYDHLQIILAENQNLAENEIGESAQQSIVNCTLETEIENLLAADTLYKGIGHLVTGLECAIADGKDSVREIRARKRQKDNYLKCQERYTALSKVDELEYEMDRATGLYEQLMDEGDMEEAEVARWTAERTKDSDSVLAVATSSATSPTYKTYSSLKLDLPKFGGDPVKWKMFWQLFDARMQKEEHLTDAEKITCLEITMKTENGKEQVQRAAVSGR